MTFTMNSLRTRVESGIESRWMGGIVVIGYEDGELNAIPGANLTDASYTEKPSVLSGAMDSAEAEEFLSMTDEEILAWAQEAYQA